MQTAVVFLIIVAAIGYLGFRAYKLWFGKQQKGCEKCAVHKEPAKK
jgi:uncharacterized membrane protein YebE (DUF533 family)